MDLKKISIYWKFTRPFTLIPPLLGILSGSICAFGSVHNPDPQRSITFSLFFTIFLGALCASILNAASNVLNQIYDLEIDKKNKPNRFLVTGEISLKSAYIFTFILYLIAILPTFLVVPYPYESFKEKFFAPLMKHEVFWIYLIALIFTFIYSAPFLGRTKKYGILANLTIAIPRGFLLKLAGWGFVASVFCFEAAYIGFIFFLFLMGASSTKDFSDMEGDKLGGCKTLPIIYGPKKACLIISPFFIIPWLLIPLGIFLKDPSNKTHKILTGNPNLLILLSIILTIWGIYTVYLLLKDPDALTKTENHPSWTHMYLMMMSAQIGFAFSYIL